MIYIFNFIIHVSHVIIECKAVKGGGEGRLFIAVPGRIDLLIIGRILPAFIKFRFIDPSCSGRRFGISLSIYIWGWTS